jgi:uncharacterized OB-fold protein
MAASNSDMPQPLSPIIKMDSVGKPFLQGFRCSSCGEVLLEHRRGCPKCAAVASLAPVALSDRGTIFSYTIVHRSFPGIKTPFVSAVVELDGGGFVKGNLEGVNPTPFDVKFDMGIRVVFDQLVGGDGKPLLRYVFVPISEADKRAQLGVWS